METSSEVMISTPSIPSTHEMMVFTTMAKQAVESKMYRGIGEQAGVMMIMLAAREMGISPMMAINGGLNIIQGKVLYSEDVEIMGILLPFRILLTMPRRQHLLNREEAGLSSLRICVLPEQQAD